MLSDPRLAAGSAAKNDDVITWVTWLSGRQIGIAQTEFGLDCFPMKASRRYLVPFDRPARAILSKGDTVRRHDRVSWLGDTVNWVATARISTNTDFA
jgi:hypothetical protein